MSDEIMVRMRFDRQEGNLYYFIVSFWNSGLDLLQYFGSYQIAAPFSLAHLSGAVPRTLPQGMYIGAYQVPVTLRLIGCKGSIYPAWFDLIGDLISDWDDALGLLHTDDFECVYAVDPAEILPEPYNTAHQASEEAPGGSWVIPKDPLLYPSSPSGGHVRHIAASIRREGSGVVSTWAHLYTGSIDLFHIIYLLNHYPNMDIDPPEPYVEMRFWGPAPDPNWQAMWCSYDTRWPQREFDDYSYNYHPIINCIDGLASGPHPVYSSDDSNVGWLDPVKTGHHAWLLVPYASEPFFFFTEPPVDAPSGHSSIFLPLTMELVKIGSFLPKLQIHVTSLFELDGEQFMLDGSPFELQ